MTYSKHFLVFLFLTGILSAPAHASDEMQSCAGLKSAQDKMQASTPKSCPLAKKLQGEFKATAPKFLERCKAVEAMAGTKISRDAEKEQRMALQAFLEPPSLDQVLNDSGKSVSKECDEELGPLLQYRHQALKIIASVGSKLTSHP